MEYIEIYSKEISGRKRADRICQILSLNFPVRKNVTDRSLAVGTLVR